MARGKIGELQPSSPSLFKLSLVGSARRTRFSKSSESPIIGVFTAGTQRWIVMGKPGKECQLLEMVVKAVQRNHGNQSSAKRIAHFEVALTSADLANGTPWSYRRGGVISKRIIRAVADAIEAFKISIANTDTAYDQLWSQLETTAFVPLWHENRPRGAIIFYRLLPQQKDIDLADRELLRLLSLFSGPSLFNA